MPLLALFLRSLKPKYNMADTCSLFCHKNNYGEFVAVIIHLQKMENEHFCRALMFFDKDGSGYIELDELREALADESGACGTDVVNEIMREVDTYKDGEISYEEFVAMMKTRMIG